MKVLTKYFNIAEEKNYFNTKKDQEFYLWYK